MAIKHLDSIVSSLLAAGRQHDEPMAIVSNASLPNQFVLETSLGSCMRDSNNSGVRAPSIVVIGPVVNFRSMLNWLSEVPKPIGKVETLADFKTKQAG